MWKDKKILIAGGQGFIGYNLAIKLKELGAIITTTIHKKYDKYNEDITPYKCNLLKEQNCIDVTRRQDIVFMCAAVTHGAKFIEENPLAMVTPTTVMNTLMLDAAYKNKVKKFVFISSSAAYPDTGDRPTKEDEMFNGDPYDKYYHVGWMKRYAETLCRTYAEKIKNPMQTYVIRPSNLFGPYDNFDPEMSHVTAALIKKVADRMDPLEVWGDGNDVRDILYIEDFIDMTLKAIEKIHKFDPINIAYGKAFTIKEILKMLGEIEKFDAKIKYLSDKPSMIPIRCIDTTKAKGMGIEPTNHIIISLFKTLKWYKNIVQK